MNSLVWIILDSCRYDAFVAATTPCVERLAHFNGTAIERRYSYASWTAPSHYAFLMGMLPHTSPPGVFASLTYKQEFIKWNDRLGATGLDFARFVPHLSLPKVLSELGYHTVARVSLPVLNELTLLSKHFDDYKLMDSHQDFAGMVEQVTFAADRPTFYFLNLGETHYPYMLDEATLPRISGVHGVFRRMGEDPLPREDQAFFDVATLDRLRAQQIKCVEYVDGLLGALFDRCPRGTHLIITADHGELFGEDGYFGHGPVMHEKVFEVPFVEGKGPSSA